MHTALKDYMNQVFNVSNVTWSEESITMSGEELFEQEKFRRIYNGIYLDTLLYYPVEINSALLPFEVYKDRTLICLGYLSESTQNIIYLQHNNDVILNLL